MTPRRLLSVLKTVVTDILTVASALFLLWLFCLVFVYASFSIPSDSMQPGIHTGDMVIVEKVSTGARLFDIAAAAQGDSVTIRRMPHWREFRRGDVLVFNFVHCDSWDTLEFNVRKYYIKRCIAEPGDTLAIKGYVYTVNGDTLHNYPSPQTFAMYFPDDSAGRAERRRGYMADVSDTIDNWTVRDYGPLVVPSKGMTQPLDTVTFRRYRQIIERETGLGVAPRAGRVWLGDSAIASYTFKENYYFMAGDNALASMDSRYWGLVPEDFIVGRATFILWSKNKNGIQWKRILKAVE